MGYQVKYPEFAGIRLYNDNYLMEKYKGKNLTLGQVSINLLHPGMSLSTQLIDYLSTYFMLNICNQYEVVASDSVALRLCMSSGNSISGMPDIQLYLTNGRVLSFSSSEYFIYPTIKALTEPILGIFGIQLYNLDYNGTIGYKKEISNHFFGQLMVQKYPLLVAYTQDGDEAGMTWLIDTDEVVSK